MLGSSKGESLTIALLLLLLLLGVTDPNDGDAREGSVLDDDGSVAGRCNGEDLTTVLC